MREPQPNHNPFSSLRRPLKTSLLLAVTTPPVAHSLTDFQQ